LIHRKNIHFSKLIKAGGGLKEFNFRRPNGPQGQIYHVDVSDTRGNRIFFAMHLDQDHWKLENIPLPEWVRESEPLLLKAIAEGEQEV
jgi:hypothetical protein